MDFLVPRAILEAALYEDQHLIGRKSKEDETLALSLVHSNDHAAYQNNVLVVIATSPILDTHECQRCNVLKRKTRCFCAPDVLILVDKNTADVKSVYSVLAYSIKIFIVNVQNFDHSVLFHQKSLNPQPHHDVASRSIANIMERRCQISKVANACLNLQKTTAR